VKGELGCRPGRRDARELVVSDRTGVDVELSTAGFVQLGELKI